MLNLLKKLDILLKILFNEFNLRIFNLEVNMKNNKLILLLGIFLALAIFFSCDDLGPNTGDDNETDTVAALFLGNVVNKYAEGSMGENTMVYEWNVDGRTLSLNVIAPPTPDAGVNATAEEIELFMGGATMGDYRFVKAESGVKASYKDGDTIVWITLAGSKGSMQFADDSGEPTGAGIAFTFKEKE